MSYAIDVQTVGSIKLAVVRRVIPPGGVAAAWRPALDLVWSLIRRQEGLWSGGHNVFVYRRPLGPDGPMIVDFGVEIVRSFEGDGVVMAAETPAGRVASTRHVGPIEGLRGAYAAVDAWLIENREAAAGVLWETYGDWGPDPATWEVMLTYLLAKDDPAGWPSDAVGGLPASTLSR